MVLASFLESVLFRRRWATKRCTCCAPILPPFRDAVRLASTVTSGHWRGALDGVLHVTVFTGVRRGGVSGCWIGGGPSAESGRQANNALSEHRARGRAVGSVGDAPDGVGWLGNLAASAVRRIRLTGDNGCHLDQPYRGLAGRAIPGIVDSQRQEIGRPYLF
jgi:hypothetical protein